MDIKIFFQFLEDNNIELSSITWMQMWKWIPNLKKLEEFIKICKEKNINIKTITGKQLWIEASLELVKNKKSL